MEVVTPLNAGYRVTFKERETVVAVIYTGTFVMEDNKYANTGLRMVPSTNETNSYEQATRVGNIAANITSNCVIQQVNNNTNPFHG